MLGKHHVPSGNLNTVLLMLTQCHKHAVMLSGYKQDCNGHGIRITRGTIAVFLQA